MFKCETCGRDNFKSQSGLNRHSKNCKVVEDTNEKKETNNEIQDTKTLTEDTRRRIAKLRDLRKSTYDAHARNDIDLKIKELENGSIKI